MTDSRMPGRNGAVVVEAAPEAMGPCAAEDTLVDKLRGGDYGAMADALTEKALQLQPDGSVAEISAADAAAAMEAKPRKDPRSSAHVAVEAESGSAELDALRAARLRQLRNEAQMKQQWVRQGHGEYRQIADERAFFSDIEKHERTVCLLYSDERDELHEALAVLASQHLETMVFRLPEQRAHFMMSMLDLAGLPTLLCIRHGKVVESLPPAVLRKAPIAVTLARLGMIDDEEVEAAKRDSDRESDDEEEDRPRRFFRRV
jgi:hypothetical protein